MNGCMIAAGSSFVYDHIAEADPHEVWGGRRWEEAALGEPFQEARAIAVAVRPVACPARQGTRCCAKTRANANAKRAASQRSACHGACACGIWNAAAEDAA